MFSVKVVDAQGLDKIVLYDGTMGTIVELLPDHGAMLHSFSINTTQNERIELIDNYTDAADIAKNLTAKGFKSSKLSPFVCRLANGKYSFEGSEFTVSKFKLGHHAIHGLLYDRPFALLEKAADPFAAWAIMECRYRGEEEGFPFHYDCTVTYSLQENARLSICTKVINRTDGPMPIQDGWHPYFSLGASINDLQLQFNASSMVQFDEGLIPTGKFLPFDEFDTMKLIGDKAFDNCFVLASKDNVPACVLRNEQRKIQLEIFAKENYPYLQIYTPMHRRSIAIENLSGVPDAFNNGIGATILGNGAHIGFETIYKITHPYLAFLDRPPLIKTNR